MEIIRPLRHCSPGFQRDVSVQRLENGRGPRRALHTRQGVPQVVLSI